MKKTFDAAILTASSLMLFGCQVGPKYVKPSVPAPPPFKSPLASNLSGSVAWNPVNPSDQTNRGKWWSIFGDAQLSGLEEQVVTSNQDLKVAEARLRQARSAIRFNRAAEFPMLAVAPSIGNERLSENQPYFSKTLANNGTGNFLLPLEFSYEVDLWGRVRRSVTAAKAEAQASAGDVEAAKLSLQAEVARDYFELRSADLQKSLLADTATAYERALKLAQERYDGGAAPRADVEQSRTQLESTRVLETDIDQQRQNYENALAVLIGESPSEFTLPPVRNFKLEAPTVPVGVPSSLLERRPDVAAAERRIASANEQIGIAKSAYYPQLTIGASAGFQSTQATTWFNWPSRLWAVGPTVSQTIFDGGRRRANTEAAQAGYDGAVALYRQESLTAFQEVEDALSALVVLEKEIGQQQRATAAASRALELFQMRYKDGADTYLQVVVAQSTALQNERNEIDLRRRRVDAIVLLIKAVGGGWDSNQLPRY